MNNGTAKFDPDLYLAKLRKTIDGALESAMAGLAQDCPERLRDAMGYSLLGPGKRLRPMLTLLAARWSRPIGDDGSINDSSIDGSVDDELTARVMPSALAIEMVHCYSLIHDDLPAMDDDDYRRGRLTGHKRFDVPTALLAGDALLTFAFETIAKTTPDDVAARCAGLLAKAAGPTGMVAGQMEDIIVSGLTSATDDALERYGLGKNADRESVLRRIHRGKTAALVVAALELGAVATNADETCRRALRQYGNGFGMAFQITDDLLDVTGDESIVGKKLRKDSEHDKLTFPMMYDIETCRLLAREQTEIACAAIGGDDRNSVAAKVLVHLAQSVLTRSK